MVLYEEIRSDGKVCESGVGYVQGQYDRSEVGTWHDRGFHCESVSLHQGSALNHLLFAIVIDRLMDEIRQEAP